MNFQKLLVLCLLIGTSAALANSGFNLSLDGPGTIAPGSTYECKANLLNTGGSAVAYSWSMTPSGDSSIEPKGETVTFKAGKTLEEYTLTCTATYFVKENGVKTRKSTSSTMTIDVSNPLFYTQRQSADPEVRATQDDDEEVFIFLNVDSDGKNGEDRNNSGQFFDDELVLYSMGVIGNVYANYGTFKLFVSPKLNLWKTSYRDEKYNNVIQIDLSSEHLLSNVIKDFYNIRVEAVDSDYSSISFSFDVGIDDYYYETKCKYRAYGMKCGKVPDEFVKAAVISKIPGLSHKDCMWSYIGKAKDEFLVDSVFFALFSYSQKYDFIFKMQPPNWENNKERKAFFAALNLYPCEANYDNPIHYYKTLVSASNNNFDSFTRQDGMNPSWCVRTMLVDDYIIEFVANNSGILSVEGYKHKN